MIERKVAIEELEEGMFISADVHNSNGVVIVPAKTTVTIEVLNLLARHSIMEVVVGEESDAPELSLEDYGILDDALFKIKSNLFRCHHCTVFFAFGS